MAMKDYYKILGVEKTASQDEIKSAYRKLAKKYHPDLHPDDKECAEKFKECNEAYSVLGDPDKRQKYDRGEIDESQGFNPFGNGGGFTASGFDDIFDIFSGFMGGGARSARRSTRQAVGEDITQTIELTFMEAALGCKKSISFTRLERCKTCNGTGAKNSDSLKTCPKCNGTGQVRYTQNTLFGQQISIGTCTNCNGTGKIVTDKCPDCNGNGVVRKNKVMNVTIPAGVENGSVLQIAGEGNSPRGAGRNGNLLLVLSIKPSKVFSRRNLDIYTEVPVTFSTAVMGGEVEIPSLQGMFVHKLASGSGNGETLRFRGKGIQSGRGQSGDLYVTFKVEVPRSITRAQRKSLEDFERDSTISSYPKRKEYLDELARMYQQK